MIDNRRVHLSAPETEFDQIGFIDSNFLAEYVEYIDEIVVNR